MGTDVAKEEPYIIGKTPGKEAILVRNNQKSHKRKRKKGKQELQRKIKMHTEKQRLQSVSGTFWDMVNKHDILGLTETWLEEKEWDKWKKKVPNTFAWKSKHVSRVKKKGRAKRGIITGIKHHLQEIQTETTYT
ncbi:hypothetical protein CBL_07154 [Carabus blaptoides fortunei]